jgi:NADPH2:quinone reductase
MKAIVIEGFGEADVFREREVAERKLNSNEVRIQVKATSVNPLDYKIRKGLAPAWAPDFPAILHGDVSGVISEVGSEVKGFGVGDEVYGCVGGVKGSPGVLCEAVIADPQLVAKKPKSLNFRQAAALPLAVITAWEGLDKAKIQSGQHVLVHGGTGGVGHLALQLANIRGARVSVSVGNTQKFQMVKSLGAHEVIDYKNESIRNYVERLTQKRGFDVVFDTVGGENLIGSMEAARLNGTVINIQARGNYDLTLMHMRGLSLHVVFMLIPLLHHFGRERHGKILADVASLVDAGKVIPLVDEHSFTFAQIAEAHRFAESGQAVGKIVVTRGSW